MAKDAKNKTDKTDKKSKKDKADKKLPPPARKMSVERKAIQWRASMVKKDEWYSPAENRSGGWLYIAHLADGGIVTGEHKDADSAFMLAYATANKGQGSLDV